MRLLRRSFWNSRQTRPDQDSDGSGYRLPWSTLLVLAAAMFVSQTIEYLPGGLLPNVADDLGQPVAAVGQLVTAFAAAVVLTTAPMSALTRRLPRRGLLLGSLVAITLATLATAAAPTFPLLVLARVAAGVAHGTFWTVAGAYAAYLVPHHLLGRAMAITGLGGSLAGILGVPLGNALGQWMGWRTACGAVAGLGAIITLATWRLLPPVKQPAAERPARGTWNGTMPAVMLACVVLLLVVLGPAIFSTYSVPWLEDVADLPRGAVPIYLLLGGAAGTIGLIVTGALFDRHPRTSFAVAGTVSVAAIAGMALAGALGAPLAVIGVSTVWAAAYSCLPAMLMTRVMKEAAPSARPLAAALQTTAINVALAGGAATGGAALGVVDLAALPWVAAVVLAVGVAVLVIVDLMRRRRESAPQASSEPPAATLTTPPL
ncbi:MFS transporter [Nocardioides sp. WG-D5]